MFNIFASEHILKSPDVFIYNYDAVAAEWPAGGGEASCESSAVLCGRVLAELIECVADRERLLRLARRVLHALCCAVLSIPELVRVVAAGGECSVLPARRPAVHLYSG